MRLGIWEAFAIDNDRGQSVPPFADAEELPVTTGGDGRKVSSLLRA